MASYDKGNESRLREAGLIAEESLPDELRSVVEGLTGDEIDILVSVKRRLDAADISPDLQAPERPRAPWEVWMVF